MKSKKIGNTSFNIEAVKKMTWEQFNKTYSKIGLRQDLKELFIELGGKVEVKAKPKTKKNAAVREDE